MTAKSAAAKRVISTPSRAGSRRRRDARGATQRPQTAAATNGITTLRASDASSDALLPTVPGGRSALPGAGRGSTRGQLFFSSSASITMMPLGPRT